MTEKVKVLETNVFARAYKKLHSNQKDAVDGQARSLEMERRRGASPKIGSDGPGDRGDDPGPDSPLLLAFGLFIKANSGDSSSIL